MEGTELFMVLGWASPIGLGIFLVCIAVMIWLLRKSERRKN
jgi:hypothetical protein